MNAEKTDRNQAVRELYLTPGETTASVARAFGINQSTAARIIYRMCTKAEREQKAIENHNVPAPRVSLEENPERNRRMLAQYLQYGQTYATVGATYKVCEDVTRKIITSLITPEQKAQKMSERGRIAMKARYQMRHDGADCSPRGKVIHGPVSVTPSLRYTLHSPMPGMPLTMFAKVQGRESA